MSSRRELLTLCLFGLMIAAIAATGIGVRATHGAQTTADEPQYLLSALSLWEDGDLDISDELSDERYRDFHEVELPEQTLLDEDGRRISPHDPLLPVLLAVPMGLWGWVGAKATLAAVGGLLAALIVWTARNRLGVSSRVAYLTAALFALAPPLAIYSSQVYPEIPAALALLGGFAAVLGPFEKRGRIVFAVAVIALPWLAVKYVPLAAVLAVFGLVRAGRGRRLGLLLTFVVGGAVYVVGHQLLYGGLTAYAAGDHFVGGEFTAVGSDVSLPGRATRLIGLLVDRGFGIAAWQPAYLLLPPVTGWALARRRRDFVFAGWLVGAGWLMATFVALTMHGWWFPGRQLVVILPLAVLVVSAWADEARRRRTLVGLGSLGVVALVFLLVEGLREQLTWVVDFGATSNPIYRSFSMVLPDYMAPSPITWALHGLWLVVVLALWWLGWRSGSDRRHEPRSSDNDDKASQERVMT